MSNAISKINSSNIKPISSPIVMGPLLHYRGENTTTHVAHLSLMLLVQDKGNKTSLPKVALHTDTDKELEGKIVASVRDHLFTRYDLHLPKTSEKQQLSYSVDGKEYPIYIPAIGEASRMALYSCNGYQTDDCKDDMGGIQPLWKELLREHKENPFSLLVGLGDQIYCDGLVGKAEEPKFKHIRGVFALPSLQEWLAIEDKEKRNKHSFTLQMAEEVTEFYFEHYCRQFNEPKFKDALASIPSIMTWDDHDSFDGMGSYPESLQNSPVFKGIFETALMYYLLFQHQVTPTEMQSGHLFGKNSCNFLFTVDEGKTAILGVDGRSERTENQVVSPETWKMLFEKLETLPMGCRHLMVMLGVPVAYPSLQALDSTLETADERAAMGWLLSKAPGMRNQFKEWELADDGRDHWGHAAHVEERNQMLQKFEAFGKKHNIRVTLLGGDVHIGGAGKIYNINSDKNNRAAPETIWQVITSPIGNTPAPSVLVTFLKGVARKSTRIDEERSMKLVSLQHESDPGDRDSLFAKRNFAVAQRDPKIGSLEVQLHLEPKRGKKRKICHVHSLSIPPNRPGFWQEKTEEIISWWDRFTASIAVFFISDPKTPS